MPRVPAAVRLGRPLHLSLALSLALFSPLGPLGGALRGAEPALAEPALAAPAAIPAAAASRAREILAATGVSGGLVVHLGCGSGELAAALGAREGFLVQGLERDAEAVRAARARVRELGRYGPVSIRRLEGARLPFIDALVNLLVVDDAQGIPREEWLRVLAPGGVAWACEGERWSAIRKERPSGIDDWTHYLHDATNNAVSRDTVVAPPHRLQWVGSPLFTRHHDRMSSFSAAVSAGGRVFYIFDEAPAVSALIPPRWSLIARDAFNGTVLWKRRIETWFTHLWPLKSGPAELPRRLVASGDRVWATLGITAPLDLLDAASGKTIRTYEGTAGTEEVLLSGDLLLALVNPKPAKPRYAGRARINQGYRGKFWNEAPRWIVALRPESGERIWRVESRVLPATLALDSDRVYLHDGERIVALERGTGQVAWRSEPVARADVIRSFYLPTLLVQDGVVLFSGGETAGAQTGSWYRTGKDTMTALSARDGHRLWSAPHPPSGYRSPEDLLVIDGTVWTGETTSGRAPGLFTGRDLRTGEVKVSFEPDVETYWFHHRCYRGKATVNYLLMSRAGTEYVDVRRKHWNLNHWFRGACLYGVMPANGLMYAPPSPCACYLESRLLGLNALAAGRRLPADRPASAGPERLWRGPAFGAEIADETSAEDWPTYRHDPARSGCARTEVPSDLGIAWRAKVGGRLTSPVVAGGRVIVASVDAHTLHSLDAASGEERWSFTAGGRIDSPPTVWKGRAIFGSADGSVYSLRAGDGALLWRLRAAPSAEQLVAFEQIESVWPVPGSVLVENDVAYCVAGRSMFLDGGLRFLRIDPASGRVLSETVLSDRDSETGKDLQEFVTWLNMPAAQPDILSSDGRHVFMRSLPFRLDGTRLPLKKYPTPANADGGAPPPEQQQEFAHLFSPTGFRDDSWWHRSYWLYGSAYISGWCGYYLAGKVAPAGKILVFDDSRVFGYGREPQYFRWTVPIEHRLFAASRKLPPLASGKPTSLRVAKSESLSAAGEPATVEARVKCERRGGVILARGGGNHGYALYLEGGKPAFCARAGGKLGSVVARKGILGRWAHVAGQLTAGELRLWVDGELVATAPSPGLLPQEPLEGLEVGLDDSSSVGEYAGPAPFQGLVDEVRLWRRALSAREVAAEAAGRPGGEVDRTGLVLAFDFDRGDARDGSGHGNHGAGENLSFAPAPRGRAARFSGKVGRGQPYLVEPEWAGAIPIFARAMALAGGKLFVAGPLDEVDEPEAFRDIDDPEVQKRLADQEAVWEGARGSTLLVVSSEDGKTRERLELPALPVFDGLAAARGRLYLSTTEGEVFSLAGR